MAKRTKQERGEIPLHERIASIPDEVKNSSIEVYSEERRDVGRPRKKIDPMQVYELARIHCTMEEMAAALLIGTDLLSAHFSEIISLGRSEGKSGLRRSLYKETEMRNTQAMIWLSKNYLGMRDQETQQQTQINFNVNVNEVPK